MTRRVIEQLARDCKRLRITHDHIAAATEPRAVTRTMVSKVFSWDKRKRAFHAKSSRVVEAAQRLVAERDTASV